MGNTTMLDRVILSTTEHGNHIQFWPLVATAWRRWLGVKVSLALVTRRSADDLLVRELARYGEVTIFPEVPGIPNQNLAKVSRYLMAMRCGGEVCLIDDVDMLPLQSAYYLDLLRQRQPGEIMVVGAEVYENTPHAGKHPIANLTAEGATFKAWLNPTGLDDLRLLDSWKGLRVVDAKESVDTDPAMFSDESMLRALAKRHPNPKVFRHVRRGFYPYTARALDRSNWRIEFDKLKSGHYVEAHLLRPLSQYKDQIEPLALFVASSPEEDPRYWDKIAAAVAKANRTPVTNAAEVAYAHLKESSRFGEKAPLVSQGLVKPEPAAPAPVPSAPAAVPPPAPASRGGGTALSAPLMVPQPGAGLVPQSLPIAIVTETMNYTSGGIRCIAEVLNRLQARGYRVQCFVTQPDLRCEWLPVQFPIRPLSELAQFRGVLISPFSPTAQLVARSAAVGKFYWVHSYEPKFPEITGRPDSWRVMSEESYRLPQLQYFATSTYVKMILELIYRREVLSTLVPGGVDTGLFKPLPRQNRVPRVMFLSRENPFRGAQDIVRALETVRQQGVELDVCVMGHPLPMGRVPHRHFPALPQVEFARLLASADIFVHASHFEGLPLPPLEAMAAKCAVIATYVGASDYLLDGYNALVVPPKRPDLIAAALLRLARDPALRERLAEGGLRTVREGYTWEHTVDRLEAVLKEGMARQGVALVPTVVAAAPPAPAAKASRLLANWLERADKAFAKGDADSARDCLMAAHDLDPARIDILTALSGLAFSANQFGEALEWIDKAVALQPADAALRVRQAAIAARSERFDLYEQALGEVFRLDPNNTDAMQLVAELNFQQGNYVEAADWFRRLVALKPSDLNVLLTLGKCFFEIKDYAAAEMVYQEVLRLEPSHTLARENLEVIARKLAAAASAGTPSASGASVTPTPASAAPSTPASWLNQSLQVRRSTDGSGMVEINGVQGYLLEGDIEFLFNCARRLPPGAKILEVGSFMGLSSILLANGLLAAGNTEGRIVCVDTWKGSEGAHQRLAVVQQNQLFDRFLDNIRRAGVESMIQPVRKPSAEAASDFPDASFDFIFIDGDHSFAGCYADLVAFYSKLKPGGVFIGHDCTPEGGVRQALLRFAAERQLEYDIVEPPRAHYIFQLRQPLRTPVPPPVDTPPTPTPPAPTSPPTPPTAPVAWTPRVSALVSTYRSERFLRGCLEDLEAQTIAADLEIIVIDSNSPENERAIVEEFQQRYHNIIYLRSAERETVYGAWNRGIQQARGQYLTNANTDDRHRPDALEILARTLDERPDITLVYADCLITRDENATFASARTVGNYRWLDFDPKALLAKGCFVGPQPMWRKSVHEEHGYFDPTFVSAGDYEFWLRIAANRQFLHVRETLGLYLESPGSVEHSNRDRAAQETQEARNRYRAILAPESASTSTSASAGGGTPAAPLALPPCGQVARLKAGYELLGKQDFAGTWKFGLTALEQRPFHPEAFVMMGEAARGAGHVELARQCARRALELVPSFALAQQLLAGLPKKAKKRQLDWPALPPSRTAAPTLTVCVIAKNEEKFIAQCLQSIRPVARQIVLLDTGSTDRTVEIAASLGAEIHRFAWTDHFSDARNAALEHARGDWVLCLDADEEILPAEHPKLLEAMKAPSVMGYRLPLTNCGLDEAGGSFVPRFFRNAPGLFFVGRVHEQVFPSVMVRCSEWKMKTEIGGAQIRHHGYASQVMDSKQKVERNLRLLQQAVEELPDEPNLEMNLGLELSRSGQTEEGLVHYRRAFELMSRQDRAFWVPELREALLTQYPAHLMPHKRYAEAVEVLSSPLAVEPGLTASMHYLRGGCHFLLQQYEAAAEQMTLAIAKRQEPVHWPVINDVMGVAPRHYLANSLALLQRFEEAVAAFRQALAEDPHHRQVRLDFARLLHTRGQSVEAITLLHESVRHDPTDAAVWELGARIVTAKPEFFEVAVDWTAEAILNHPRSPVLQAARAETLLLAQETAASLQLWTQLPEPTLAQRVARFLCQLAEGAPEAEQPLDFERQPGGEELPWSREFVRWYQRLLAWQSAEVILAINRNLSLLKQRLPSAAQVIGAAMAEAGDAPVAPQLADNGGCPSRN